jgi:hypothetical protein
LVSRFNQEGLVAIEPRHGGGPQPVYSITEQARIFAEARRTSDREQDGTASWSLSTLQQALRRAGDGLPQVSTFTIWMTLRQAGWSWQQDRTWCDTGKVKRKRKDGIAEVIDPDATPKKLDRESLPEGRSAGFSRLVSRPSRTFSNSPLI